MSYRHEVVLLVASSNMPLNGRNGFIHDNVVSLGVIFLPLNDVEDVIDKLAHDFALDGVKELLQVDLEVLVALKVVPVKIDPLANRVQNPIICVSACVRHSHVIT